MPQKPTKPRILMFLMLPLWGSGSGVYVRKLAQTLANQGYEVAIACPERRRVPGVKIYHVNLPWMAVFGAHPEYPDAPKYPDLSSREFDEIYRAFHYGLTKAVNDFQPDVIHCHHAFYLSWIANYCRAIYQTSYLVTVHGTDVYNASQDRRYVLQTQDALKHAEVVSVVSPQTRKWMFQVFGRKYQEKVRTILGGVDIHAFPATGDTSKVDRKYGLTGKQVVAFTGRLFPTKGVQYLVRAAKDIDAEVLIIGDGPEKSRLQALARDNPRVHFPGYVKWPELASLYRRADVIVVPSVWDEPLGLISLEAMASGTPVVASNKGGIGAAVKHGQTGYLVRARSGRAISEAVNRLLTNPDLRTKMGLNARALVEEKFSWETIAGNFPIHYKAAAEKTRRRKQRKLPVTVTREDLNRAKPIIGPQGVR